MASFWSLHQYEAHTTRNSLAMHGRTQQEFIATDYSLRDPNSAKSDYLLVT
jgi:hypothetical protein